MFSISDGQGNLKRLIAELDSDSNMNEAQTRFHIIDKILFDCLGWQRCEVEVEKAEDNQFTDYELGKPRLAILEAKREGASFFIPAGTKKKLLVDIKSLCLSNDALSGAIRQAQDYCSKRGVPIAIVSNGRQFVIFLASRQDGVHVLDGNAIVFNGLDHLLQNFTKAWQFISSDGIKERSVFSYLNFGERGLPTKLSSKLDGYPIARYSSAMQSSLRQLSELFLQDVIEHAEVEEKFFNECYCESGALSNYALLSKNILEARYASLFSSSELAPHLSPVREKKGKDNVSPDILLDSITKRPIVLLGDVGVGKTSFIKNLIYNSAYQEFKNAIYVYIDLGSNAALASDLRQFVLSEIESQLYEKYGVDIYDHNLIKGVYASEISRFAKGIWGKKKDSEPDVYDNKLIEMLELHTKQIDQHMKKTIEYYSKTSRRQVIISLDNADQRDFEVQQDTFIIAQELAKQWASTVFVSVRPQTFFRSKKSGALTAYPHKIFTISPPRIDLVISKRLRFALKMSEGKIPVETMQYLTINSENLSQFIKALLTSLSDNNELFTFLSNITGGNIRAAIEFVTGFIGSPNVDAEKIIDIMNKEGRYRIPLHEFTKSALLGDYSHYNPEISMAMNVYDVSTTDSYEHFLTPILLSYLDCDGSHKDKDGFCLVNTIFSELQNIGYTQQQIESSLRKTTNKKLIETAQRVTFDEDENGALIGSMPSSFRITTIGAYHLKRWLCSFTYLDAMIFDTPIFDNNIIDEVMPNLNSLSINHRYERAIAFKLYLGNVWHGMSNKPVYFNFESAIRDGSTSFDSVKRAVSNIV